ncbi:MAG TPA: T9SS type B sorting domain-containing protein [Bacteroidetes bacterium]|nr:T9SS type B sorting domain-containing protein [Bacteroidota bacterium]
MNLTFCADNINDIFKPLGIPEGILEYEMSLWDRWGHMFFKTNDLEEGWDGTKEGILVKPGAYVYYIRIKDFMGLDHVLKGTFLKLK